MRKIFGITLFGYVWASKLGNNVQGFNNFIIGSQNDVYGNNNYLVGANHKVIGDNVHMFGPQANIHFDQYQYPVGHRVVKKNQPNSANNQKANNVAQK